MKAVRHIAILVALFFFFGLFQASANTANISFDPVYGEQPFSFFCPPYGSSLQENKHYILEENTRCTFSIPNTITGRKAIVLYKGTVGNASMISGDLVLGFPTLVWQEGVSFYGLQQDDELFAAVYDHSALGPDMDQALMGKAEMPTNAVLNENYFVLPWKWGVRSPEEFNPVLIIPGILGSWEKDGEWILDPIRHVYDNLADTLLANGYEEGETLFKFPYDWRNPNTVTAELLGQKIEEVRTICDCEYVDVVAHSMGGLVAMQYLAHAPVIDVEHLVFIATPFNGAPKAYKIWEGGEVTSGSNSLRELPEDFIMQRIFTKEARENGYDSIFEYLHSKPISSVQELLPVFQDYLRVDGEVLKYPTGYPENTFLNDLLHAFSGRVYGAVRKSNVVAEPAGNQTIVGFNTQPSAQLPKWEHGEPIETYYGEGDGTVPLVSYDFLPPEETFRFEGVNHTSVVSAGAADVFKALTSRSAEVVVDTVYGELDTDFEVLIESVSPSPSDFKALVETIGALLKEYSGVRTALVFLLFSPVDMQITAPDGAKIGKDFSTNSFVNEVPDAVYSGFDAEHEFVIVFNPLPGEYKVDTVGTGAGAYTVAVGYANNEGEVGENMVEGVAAVGKEAGYFVAVSGTTTQVQLVAQEEPPQVEEGLTPDSCITDLAQAYKDKWIKKKRVYSKLVADCRLLKTFFKTQEKLPERARSVIEKLVARVLNDMDKLAKDKGNSQEAKELIYKYTTWFRGK